MGNCCPLDTEAGLFPAGPSAVVVVATTDATNPAVVLLAAIRFEFEGKTLLLALLWLVTVVVLLANEGGVLVNVVESVSGATSGAARGPSVGDLGKPEVVLLALSAWMLPLLALWCFATPKMDEGILAARWCNVVPLCVVNSVATVVVVFCSSGVVEALACELLALWVGGIAFAVSQLAKALPSQTIRVLGSLQVSFNSAQALHPNRMSGQLVMPVHS
jgi:hypothetical protein